MIRHAVAVAVVLALALAPPALAAPAPAPAPKIAIASFAELKTPLPYPYDEAADADAQVARAKARARVHGKLLLVDLGGNWCGDCRILSATMDRPELKAFVARHYEVVLVDVGHMDKNLQIPSRYGIDDHLAGGVPALLVVDPRTNKLLDGGHISALEDARHMTPQALADWLAQWTR
jgi:thiol-disulfide isomerase/thioredoxin